MTYALETTCEQPHLSSTCLFHFNKCVLPLTASVLFKTSIFRFPNIACELLTCDVGVINDKLGNEEPLLETLYAFLEQPSPLNPLLASFFSKTIGNLITRKTEQVMR